MYNLVVANDRHLRTKTQIFQAFFGQFLCVCASLSATLDIYRVSLKKEKKILVALHLLHLHSTTPA